MSNIANPVYLRDQYRDGANLNKRASLHARFSVNPQGIWDWAFDRFALPGRARILELGCGPACMWARVAGRVPPGWEIILTDFSPGMAAEAKRTVGALGLPARMRCLAMDAQEIAFGDGAFDAVIANFMLYHVPDRPRALREIRRVLRQGAALFAITVGENHLRELSELRRAVLPDTESWGATTPENPAAVFSLQNGGGQLAPFFSRVSMETYPDALCVTDPHAVADHVLSAARGVGPQQRAAIVALAQKKMDDNGGVLNVTKETGLFICHP